MAFTIGFPGGNQRPIEQTSHLFRLIAGAASQGYGPAHKITEETFRPWRQPLID
jgi:hypothetical protein